MQIRVDTIKRQCNFWQNNFIEIDHETKIFNMASKNKMTAMILNEKCDHRMHDVFFIIMIKSKI